MTNRDIIVIGGSAGFTGPLRTILFALTSNLKAAVVVTVHVPAASDGILRLASSASLHLPVKLATNGEPVLPGTIYLASANRHHLLMDRVVLGNGQEGTTTSS